MRTAYVVARIPVAFQKELVVAKEGLRSYSEARETLLSALSVEVLGPSAPDEEISQIPPHRRYVIGQLTPAPSLKSSDVGEIEQQAWVVDDREEAPEGEDVDVDPVGARDGLDSNAGGQPDATLHNRTSVSSIGISFVVTPGTELSVSASWGEYTKIGERRWKRTPRSQTISLPRLLGSVNADIDITERATLSFVSRPQGGFLVASVFLTNRTKNAKAGADPRFYQAELRLEGANKNNRPFLNRELLERELRTLDEDTQENFLLYQYSKEYGVGRHTAVEALDVDSLSGVAGALRTVAIPTFELPVLRARESDSKVFDMKYLADQKDPHHTARALRDEFEDYGRWINQQRAAALNLRQDLRSIAERRLDACSERLNRILAGISTLESDPDTFAAFVLACEAMARVRFRDRLLRPNGDRSDGNFDDRGREGAWRPFQLAFFLSIIPDLTEAGGDAHKLRDIVDVLFFPTGGGKTEAYLAAIAYSAALRRRRGHGAGVSAILRYTLRLLSSQQLARAATLMCALEIIRREASAPTSSFSWLRDCAPFSIGLWVGGKATPNTSEAAKKSINHLRNTHRECSKEQCDLVDANNAITPQEPPRKRGHTSQFSVEYVSPLTLSTCPWCSAPLCISDVSFESRSERTLVVCPESRCFFSGNEVVNVETPFFDLIGLPIVTVDDEVFRTCPTVVVGTVDKFATLWSKPSARALFGHVSRLCSLHGYLTDVDGSHNHKEGSCDVLKAPLDPLDLFVQDELHLISEALGSAYGFVETAIEWLATSGKHKPKYIAATATIRRASNQVRQLFARATSIFPLSPIRAGDAYFSSYASPTPDDPGRTYVGLYAPSQSRLYQLVVYISTLLGSAALARQSFAGAADPYLTLVLYFNTLRDLGQVQGLLVDDVPKQLAVLAARNNWPKRLLRDVKRELTSKATAAELPKTMAKICATFEEEEAKGRPGCDAVSATNMLSVGVDIPRLGLMLVDGQPKTTSEYIQATSRVGRQYPGIVLVAYNAGRPRDLSHYEHFYAYHDALYRFVESVSVTPFSSGTVDKYLPNALISAFRLGSGFSASDSPKDFGSRIEARDRALRIFKDRASMIARASEQRYLDEALAETAQIWDQGTSAPKLIYGPAPDHSRDNRKSPADYVARVSSVDQRPKNVMFDAPMSLRNVEPELTLRVEE